MEDRQRRPAELDGDLGPSLTHRLTGAQVERNSGPAPSVDLELESDVSLDWRCRGYVGLLPISRDGMSFNHALAVLAAHSAIDRHRRDRVQNISLAVAHGVRIQAGRRLHRGHRQELEQMIWDHVAERAGLFVELPAALDPHRLGNGDLHMVDMVPIPDRLEEFIGEPNGHDALDRLLAEEMVDPID